MHFSAPVNVGASLLLLSVALSGCQPTSTDSSTTTASVTHQTTTVSSSVPKAVSDTPSQAQPSSTQASASASASIETTPETPINVKSTKPALSESGFHGLPFGQRIDKAALEKVGLAYPFDANNHCYYVPVSAKGQNPSPVLLQIIDNRFGAIEIKDDSLASFANTQVGQDVKFVLSAHIEQPVYIIDKYDDGSGKQYQLTYTLGNGNQIEYTLVNGEKMPMPEIQPNDWNQDLKNGLKGQVERITIGTPSAIALAEGCS